MEGTELAAHIRHSGRHNGTAHGVHRCRYVRVESGVTAQAGRVSGRCPGALSIAGEDTYRCESIGYEVDG